VSGGGGGGGGGGGSGSLGGICMGRCGILGVGVAVCAAVLKTRRLFEGESRCCIACLLACLCYLLPCGMGIMVESPNG